MKRKVLIVHTIGHGTHPLPEFILALNSFDITQVVDIRKMPRSGTNPQFNFETLSKDLDAAGMAYRHMPGLTGLRKRARNSINSAWQNKSFQAFADYMQTDEFAESINELIEIAKAGPTVIMCAETLPWRCHRSLVADALVVRGVAVQHIMSASKAQIHFLRDFAEVDGTRVFYPG